MSISKNANNTFFYPTYIQFSFFMYFCSRKSFVEYSPTSMFIQSNLKFAQKLDVRDNGETQYIVIHHSQVTKHHTVNDVHRWHQKRGWAGIGYHYFVNKNGDIFAGRPRNTIGAHALEVNRNSIGICFEGDFNKDPVSDKQLDASVMLIALLNLEFHGSKIVGHKQINSHKSCPGKYFPMAKLKQKVELCKQWLVALFGEEYHEYIYDVEGELWAKGELGYDLHEFRKFEPDLIKEGSFKYGNIVDLLSQVSQL